MKITLVKGIGFIINLVWTGWGAGTSEGQTPASLSGPEELQSGPMFKRSPQGAGRRGRRGDLGKLGANHHQA
jgi:hypothetical protein